MYKSVQQELHIGRGTYQIVAIDISTWNDLIYILRT